MKKHFRAIAILSIIAATFAVHWPALQDQFVWDDTALILRDPLIRSWRLIPEGFRHFLFIDATPSNFYRPVQRLSYVFDYALYDFKPWGYHLTSIILHAAAAVMLFLCAQALIERSGPAIKSRSGLLAWLAAFAWAVHPVHSAAVTYVAGRADVLAALFGFAGLFLVAKVPDGRNRKLNDWTAALCFLLAMLSKESGVTALVISLIVPLFFGDRAGLRRGALFAAGVIVVYCGLRFSAEKTPPPPGEPAPFAAWPVLMARAWAEYAGLLVAPANLHMERDVIAASHGDVRQLVREASARDYQTLLGLGLIAAFIAWLNWTRRRAKIALLFLVAFTIAYLPTSNLFSLNATVAEHWLYFSSAFLFVAAAISLNASPLPKKGILCGVALWVGYLGARSFVRDFDWKDQRTFLTSTMLCGGDTARMMINMGVLESSEGRQQIAISYFDKALAQRPGQAFGLLGLGAACLRAHDYPRARAELEQALKIPLVQAQALQSIAVLDYQEKGADRVDLLRKAAELEPQNWPIQRRYIMRLAERGELENAMRTLKVVIDRQPYRADSWKLLGDLLTKANLPKLAGAAYAWAEDYDVHFHGPNIGNDGRAR